MVEASPPLRRGRLAAGRSRDSPVVAFRRPCLRGPLEDAAGVSDCFLTGNEADSRRPSGVPKNNVKADAVSAVSGCARSKIRCPKHRATSTYISQLHLNRIIL